MNRHPFVINFSDILSFEHPAGEPYVRLSGFVECQNDVILEVTKSLDTRYDNRGRMYVRCFLYRYIGIVPGRHVLLKYHNLHDNPDQYVHRVYDPFTGAEIFNEVLQRYQFPTFPEVLDELASLAQDLSAA